MYKKIDFNNDKSLIISNLIKLPLLPPSPSLDITTITGNVEYVNIKPISGIAKLSENITFTETIGLLKFPNFDDEELKDNFFIFKKSNKELNDVSTDHDFIMITTLFILHIFSYVLEKTPISVIAFVDNYEEDNKYFKLYKFDGTEIISSNYGVGNFTYINKIYDNVLNVDGKKLGIITIKSDTLLNFLVEKNLINNDIKNIFLQFCEDLKNELNN